MTAPLRLGLVGYPLGHSFSPVLHEAALSQLGLEGAYRLHPVAPPPEGRAALEALIERLRAKDIQGLNVTIPHKQNVIPYTDRLEPAARAIGAVNTLALEDGALVGYNTDAEGFREDLRRSFALEPSRALVLGAGGSARAVVYALARDGWQTAVSARRRAQAEGLQRISPIQTLSFPLKAQEVQDWAPALIVNTTPLGMAPDTDESPWPADLPFPRGSHVYDLVYNPAETAFMQQARRFGTLTSGGTGMLIEQAALAIRIWTGRDPSRKAMAAALQSYLAMRS